MSEVALKISIMIAQLHRTIEFELANPDISVISVNSWAEILSLLSFAETKNI